MNTFMKYVAYIAGGIFILLGFAIVFTNLFPEYIPTQFKIMMGIVFVLYGAFRIVTTLFKQRKREEKYL